jgi:hypothetical protein
MLIFTLIIEQLKMFPFLSAHFFFFFYCSTVLVGLGRFFSFVILYTVGRAAWTSDQPVARPLPTHRPTQTQNKRTQTSMS